MRKHCLALKALAFGKTVLYGLLFIAALIKTERDDPHKSYSHICGAVDLQAE